jgi:hypothetical protein
MCGFFDGTGREPFGGWVRVGPDAGPLRDPDDHEGRRPAPGALTARPEESSMIRKLPSGRYRLYSRRKDPRTGRRRNLGTFPTRAAALRHERAIQFFKRRG